MHNANSSEHITEIFETIPSYYDVMNDIMSLGLHRLWKDRAVDTLFPIPHTACYVDLACGTGDIASRLLKKKKITQTWFLVDPSINMLKQAIVRFKEDTMHYICAQAEALPFPDRSIHTLTMSFGLRNTSDRVKALEEIYRVLESGGQCMILEFHKPLGCSSILFDYYKKLIPLMGEVTSQDASSYTYLIESIEAMPTVASLESLMQVIGFKKVQSTLLQGGLVVIYHMTKGLE